MIKKAIELWKSIPIKGRNYITLMLFISFVCVWAIILYAFFSGQVTLHELIDLIFHEHEPVKD